MSFNVNGIEFIIGYPRKHKPPAARESGADQASLFALSP